MATNELLPLTDVNQLANYLFADNSIIPTSINFTGVDEAVALLPDGYGISEISGGTPNEVVRIDRGAFLTTGGEPGTENTSTSFSVSLGGFDDGNTLLTATAQDAFSGAGETQDAALVTFTFDAANLGNQSAISFDLFFGSDEFPEFVNSEFVDIAAVYVNGVNYALFNNDPNQPLSIIGESINTPGNFYTNDGDDGSDADPFTGTFDTEYDGFSVLLNVIAPVQPGINEVIIGIADTGDSIYDSGMFVGNIQGSDFNTSGSFIQENGSTGSDTFQANDAPQLFDLGGGSDSVIGTPEQFNGDFINGFTDNDALTFEGTTFGPEDVTIILGSAILDIDTDGDGTADTQVTLQGDFSNAEFSYENINGNTTVTGQNIVGAGLDLVGDATDEVFTGSVEDDIFQGLGGNDILDGGLGTDTAVYSGDQASYTLTLSPTETTIEDRRADGNGTDELSDMELLDFDSGAFEPFNLNIFGGPTTLSQEDFESFIELYIAYFNRAPDAIGLNFWGTAFASGTTLEEMATLFIDQEETLAAYPPGTSNTVFAETVFDNVLGRTPDQAGLDFWVGSLDSGDVTRDQFILEVLRGAKSELKPELGQDFVDQQLADQEFLTNKTDIGAYFAVHKGMSDVDNASSAMALFDGTDAGIDAAVAAIDGHYADALDPANGEFLMQVVGVLDDPFAGV